MTTTFETAKVGDRVWSVEHGWGKIRSTSQSDFHPLLVVFAENKYVSFKLNGSRLNWCDNQILFWNEVKIKAPQKPLEVDTKVIIWDHSHRKLKGHFSHFDEGGKICVFAHGGTCFSSEGATETWKYWELAE